MSSKMRRIRWIDEQIRANRYPNAHKVKEHFELRSLRIVYEDRSYMVNELHAPIKYSRNKEGWYLQCPNLFSSGNNAEKGGSRPLFSWERNYSSGI